ncbi:hypothetical protein AB0A73_21690 [Glycomyces sp. NPDC047369]
MLGLLVDPGVDLFGVGVGEQVGGRLVLGDGGHGSRGRIGVWVGLAPLAPPVFTRVGLDDGGDGGGQALVVSFGEAGAVEILLGPVGAETVDECLGEQRGV